jgi:flagellar biosynthesis protein FliR
VNPIPTQATFALSSIELVLQEVVLRMPLFILASLRVALTFAGMPAPFSGVAPMQIRTALSVLVTMAVLIPQLPTLPQLPLDLVVLGKAAFFELFIGMLLGLTVRVTLAAAEIAGTMLGQTMGLGFAGSVDPSYGESLLPTAFLLEAMAALVFFSLGCHHVLLSGLAASFQAAPIGAPITAAWRGSALTIGADLVARGVQIASPIIASMFIVQVGTAFVSRIAPRVHLFAFTFSISVGAGMLLLWAAAPAVCTAVVRQVQHLPDALAALGSGR